MRKSSDGNSELRVARGSCGVKVAAARPCTIGSYHWTHSVFVKHILPHISSSWPKVRFLHSWSDMHVCIHIDVCIYKNIYKYIYIYTCISISIYISMSPWICLCVYIRPSLSLSRSLSISFSLSRTLSRSWSRMCSLFPERQKGQQLQKLERGFEKESFGIQG